MLLRICTANFLFLVVGVILLNALENFGWVCSSASYVTSFSYHKSDISIVPSPDIWYTGASPPVVLPMVKNWISPVVT